MAEDEKTRESQGKGWSNGTKALIGIVVLILVLGTLAVFTLTVAVMGSLTGGSLPYTTNYRVTLPDGEPVTIGSSHILVASYENELFCDVDGTKEKLVVGQQRIISPKHAKVTVMGIPVIETDFQITLTYLGSTGKNANFDMSVKTSTQVPEIVIRHIIPPNMHAQPM
ncbi:MAG TPA: hypothetical protein VHN82_03355 [Methanoregula sp.]|nr:hypothetical protein [Methanoregula sp.]